MKVTGVGAKQNKAVIAANTTHHASQTGDVTPSTTLLRNLTQHMKNGGHRSSSSRFLDRLASKVSLVSLTSSKVSNAPNKTSSLRKERASVNATLIELKNATDRLNKTVEKRSVNNSTLTDRASSFFQTLPALLVNTTSNVTSWAKRLFGTDKDSSARVATKKVVRDTTTAELKSSVNTTESKTSALNSTGTGQSTLAITSDEEKKKSDLNISSSSLLNLTATSILKRDIGNLTADMPTMKGSNSSIILNSTKAVIERDSKVVQVPLKKLNNSTVESQLDVANLTREISEETTNSSSLISESSATLSNRTRRHSNGMRQGYRVPSRPAYLMPVRTTPKSIPVYPVTPAYGMPAAAPSQNYGMVPAPAYGMAPATSASSNGMAPALSAPAATSVYSIPAPYAPPAPPAAPATNYGMTSAPPVSAAPVYGYTTPAPYAPPAVSAPVYEMAPVAPVYSTPAPYVPAAAYGMAPPASAPAYGMAPATPAPAYGMAPAAPAPAYGMAPATPAPAYGMAPPAPAPAYGMAPPAPAPAYEMAPPAPTYTTPAPYVLAYEQSTESYYTAPLPSYTTTSAPYNLQPNVSPYGVSSPPVVSYPAQPYGSGPSRPSPTGSPWF